MKLEQVNYYAVRKSMSLTQQDIADISDVSRATVSRLENRSANVSYNKAGQVLQGLRIEGSQRPLLNQGRPTERTYSPVTRLNRALASLNATQAEVADLLGVSPKTLHNYTTGHRRMPKTVVEAFEIAFGIDLRK